MLSIEKEGWDKTGDGRFAAGYLAELAGKKSLTSPMLQRALREFPEDSLVLLMAVSVSASPEEALLIQAIKAEYRHFSPSGLFPRPSARPLRSYFQVLAKRYK